MNQSKILGTLEMSHSHYIEDQQKDNDKEQQKQDEEIYKTLANFARVSYIAKKKKGKQQVIKAQDVKPRRKNHIFKKNDRKVSDLSVSKLPNYNILDVENMSKNNVSCWTWNIFPTQKSQKYKFFLEEPCRLIIYGKDSEKIHYVFNFDTIEVQLRADFSQKSNQFLLLAQSLILKISHQSVAIIQNWYNQLKKIIDKSYGKMFKMNDIATIENENFYQTLYCTEDQFTSNCETGDILLFEDEHFFAKAQRFILNADYGNFLTNQDHVAMIIRDKKYGILMFEANSLSGVSLNPWNCMIKYGWFKYIKRIVWRKLENVERTKFFQQIIHKFVKQNLKQKYFISFEKLLSNKSYIGKKEEQKGFFCSELIAKIYKDLQILTKDPSNKNYIASNKIYPYHFSQKSDMKLQMGNLSKEYEIHFNQELLKKQYGQNFIQS